MYFFYIKKKVALSDLLFLCQVITLTSYNKPETVTALEVVVVVDVDVSGKNHYIHLEVHNKINFTFEISLSVFIIERVYMYNYFMAPREQSICCPEIWGEALGKMLLKAEGLGQQYPRVPFHTTD